MLCRKNRWVFLFLLLCVFLIICVSGKSFALIVWEGDSWRQHTIHGIIPDNFPVRYNSDDMMVFEQFVDRQSRRALKAFAEPDQQAVIFHFYGTEFLIVETARLSEKRPVMIIPVPSEPELYEGNQDMYKGKQDMFPEISNNVFYRLFNKYHIIASTYEDNYEHEKIDPEEIIKQKKIQEEKAAGICLPVDGSTLKSEKQLKIHELKVNQVLVLKNVNADEFLNFFNNNFYKISPSQKPVIEHYIKKNWQFVIIRVKNPVKGEINPPVMLKFSTPEPVFPLKIFAVNSRKRSTTNINLYVLGSKEAGAKGFYKIWQGNESDVLSIGHGAEDRKLTVLTGILNNDKIVADYTPSSNVSFVWILPSYSSMLTVSVILFFILLYNLIFYFNLEKDGFIRKIPPIAKKLIYVLVVIVVVMLISSYREDRRIKESYSVCRTNLRELSSALEIYANYNDAYYPDSLDKLVPKYIKSIPTCPDSGTDSYSHPSYMSSKKQGYLPRILCRNRHAGIDDRNNKPVVFPMCGEVRIVVDDGK